MNGQRTVAELDAPGGAEKLEVGVFLLVDGLIYGSHLSVQDTAESQLVIGPHSVAAVAVDAAVAGDMVGGGIEAEGNLRPRYYLLEAGRVPVRQEHPRRIGQAVVFGGISRRSTTARQDCQDGGCRYQEYHYFAHVILFAFLKPVLPELIFITQGAGKG